MKNALRIWIPTVAAVVLCAAAVAKFALIFHPIAARQRSPLESIFLALLVMFEVGLSWWLVSGVAERAGRAVALATFLIFSCFAGWQVVQGVSDCGCFGVVHVSPVVTLFVDLFFVLALAIGPWDRQVVHEATSRITLWTLVAGQSVIALLVALPLVSVHLANDAPLAMHVAWERTAVDTTPEVLRYVEGYGELRSGPWLLLFYRHGCRQCESEFLEFSNVAATFPGTSLAVVAMPPDDGRPEHVADCVRWFPLRNSKSLGTNVEWVVGTPALVLVDDGKFQRHFETVQEALAVLGPGGRR